MRPFCDGTHRTISFKAPSQLEDPHADPAPEGAQPRAGTGPGRRASTSTDRAACLHLVREALAALEPLAGTTDAASEAIVQLAAAVELLQEPGNGSWRR